MPRNLLSTGCIQAIQFFGLFFWCNVVFNNTVLNCSLSKIGPTLILINQILLDRQSNCYFNNFLKKTRNLVVYLNSVCCVKDSSSV